MLSNQLLLIRPSQFGFNIETSESNSFQRDVHSLNKAEICLKAQQEFDTYCQLLKENHINTFIIDDTPNPAKPDAIFPNNWFATLPDKRLFTFPMQAKNRRLERREDILNFFARLGYSINRELENFESRHLFLEGTGSMVMDHKNKIIFAAKSSRTSQEVLEQFSKLSGYNYCFFDTKSNIYHTNVLMSVGPDFAVVCMSEILSKYRNKIEEILLQKTVMIISEQQMKSHFLGNCLLVRNLKNERILIMSKSASDSLTASQKKLISAANIKVISSDISTIENIGGGSAKCMIAELF